MISNHPAFPPLRQFIVIIALILSPLSSQPANSQTNPFPTQTLKPDDILNFHNYPPYLQHLIRICLDLTSRRLSYKYGSADPNQGGFDCSGFVHYTLKQLGYKNPPRDSTQIYLWLQQNRTLKKVNDEDPHDRQLQFLRPGDILFWEGTYKVKRNPPISHVMIYLGIEKNSNRPIMAGASEGRTYHGRPKHGVGVFDFVLPNPKRKRIPWWFWGTIRTNKTRFVGYGSIPNIHLITIPPHPSLAHKQS
ncbi:MAG: C40 family peptidase [Methylacidiphilales bacterium]|nr:C40 family peptidase [Candidatus Methylacidiphilales bacterium]MDW8349216.1 NlpC/P60 family protein [Verrucomicrobiae bacterium]